MSDDDRIISPTSAGRESQNARQPSARITGIQALGTTRHLLAPCTGARTRQRGRPARIAYSTVAIRFRLCVTAGEGEPRTENS